MDVFRDHIFRELEIVVPHLTCKTMSLCPAFFNLSTLQRNNKTWHSFPQRANFLEVDQCYCIYICSMIRPDALLLAEYMGTNRIYVTESVEWSGRPIVKLKNLTIVGRKDGDITLDGKWLLEMESSGSFENITFKNGQAHCHCWAMSVRYDPQESHSYHFDRDINVLAT